MRHKLKTSQAGEQSQRNQNCKLKAPCTPQGWGCICLLVFELLSVFHVNVCKNLRLLQSTLAGGSMALYTTCLCHYFPHLLSLKPGRNGEGGHYQSRHSQDPGRMFPALSYLVLFLISALRNILKKPHYRSWGFPQGDLQWRHCTWWSYQG